MMSRRRAVVRVAAALALAGGALVTVAYQRDIRAARARVATGATIADTPCGRIEYATAGHGSTLLVVHGAGGGFDQGLDVSRSLTPAGYQVVAMSRFGYLGTPLPADASPAAQADAHACLLDALHIQQAVVIGASAGAPSAMQFAIRHPARTKALVLMVPAAYPSRAQPRGGGAMAAEPSAFAGWVFETAIKTDFLFWLMPRLAPGAVLRTVAGTPPGVLEGASDEERARVQRVLDEVQPISAHQFGLLNDAAITPTVPRYALERITAPTLIIAVKDDLYGTYEGAKYSADHIPGARFIEYATGGHLWVGHQDEVMAEITRFVDAGR